MDISRKRLLNRLGHNFFDPALLELALTHRSCGSKNNERLEFLGDAILGAIVAENLFHRFPNAREGELTRIRSLLVKGASLAAVARELDLGEHINLGSGERKSGGQHRDSILADAVEAIIGAIYLDAGLEKARSCIEFWLAERLKTLSDQSQQKDAKTRLQEYLQAKGKPLPNYQVENISGEAHDQNFTISCRVQLLSKPVMATGDNRRKAEQRAAEKVLERLNIGNE